jgi:hypothetical protein
MLRKIGFDASQERNTEFLVRHFASAETQRDLGLVSLFQKADQVPDLDCVIAVIGAGPELDFLDLDLLLLELRVMCTLGFLVLEFAEVHQAAYRRLRRRCNFHQIHTFFFSQIERGTQRHDPKLFSIQPNQTNLGGVYFVVDALRLFLGDGSVLQIIKKSGRRVSRTTLSTYAALKQKAFDQRFGRHLPEFKIASGTHGDHPRSLLLVADDDEVRPLQ